MKNLQIKKSAVPLHEKFIKERRGYGYLYILFLAVLIISVLTLISTAYSDQNGFKVLLDSVNNSNVIYFDYGKSELRSAALELLDKISEEMKSNPGYILYIPDIQMTWEARTSMTSFHLCGQIQLKNTCKVPVFQLRI